MNKRPLHRVRGAARAAKRISRIPLRPLAIDHAVSIVRHTDDAIISKTLDGIVTSWNPAAERIFGYSAAETIGRPLTLIFPPDRVHEEAVILGKIAQGLHVEHFETVRVRKDGRPIHVSVTISPVRDGSGTIVGASKIARDITAHKEAQAQLKLAAAVFTHANEAIVITSPDGRIVDVNAAFENITGYCRDETVGRSADMFKSGRQGPEVYEAMRRDLRAYGRCQGEVWSRRKDGATYAGLLTVSRVLDADGRVQNYVAIFTDITDLKQNQDLLNHLAHHDALTGLPNRILLADRLIQALAASRRHRRTVAVLYLDLDGFKDINDTHGHDVGDEFLIEIVRRMRAAIRDVDTLARMGGDEFVVVLPDLADLADCERLIARMLGACSTLVQVQSVPLRVSASIGYTLYPEDDVDADQLLRHADHAMYEAKQQGRNRALRFDPRRDAAIQTRSTLVSRFARAIAGGELCLHLQPKVHMRQGEVLGAEALLRWQHPERGLLGPAAFLPQVEDDPVIWELDEWVIRQALDQLDRWRGGALTLGISVNISGTGLQRPGFAARLAAMLGERPLVDPDRLEFEIVESTALEDVNNASRVMEACHDLGVRFAVDDFGTGYSSLTYLRRLPAETLKIDQTFVRDMLHDTSDLAIVQGVIGLAKVFGRQVIAEGVETVPHGLKLMEIGCEHAQGYGIAAPMPADTFIDWIPRWRPPDEWRRWERPD